MTRKQNQNNNTEPVFSHQEYVSRDSYEIEKRFNAMESGQNDLKNKYKKLVKDMDGMATRKDVELAITKLKYRILFGAVGIGVAAILIVLDFEIVRIFFQRS